MPNKVILTHEVTGLGQPGDVVEVKSGYARNYLIPQGFGVSWTRGGEKQIEQIKAARSAREHATIEEANHVKDILEHATVKLAVKTGAGGRLFGSVKTGDIAQAVADQGLGTIDKKKIQVSAPIKLTGMHEATVKLRDDITAVIKLQVVSAK
ncbi:50S ribosomal protein L9 [Homoserinimonas sp. OAct 916]|uniref:50S ribosomal protein L9 n=1 Tax=Homoserinimonas sp. OAct 916 TaxID=2211450 RepID=UPI000DBE0CE1|nr:50S ribosomal protein L9 [Homoserinimonas sp. OAct 916]